MDSTFKPQDYEADIYKQWQDNKAFRAPTKTEAKKAKQSPFCIIMPPPNANDPLHIGHAMFISVEDILIRYHRMQGKASLWLPGTDHAGIETQYVFEKKLAKKGKSRFDFDRETLFKKIASYVEKNSGVAVDQMKKLGASADWSRFKFTLDQDIVDLVLDTFEKLYKDKLVYRDERLVNYCTKCGTGYSDLEVSYNDEQGTLWFVRYPIKNSKKTITVATTRPETILADTGVAVHPDDKRFKHLVGKTVVVPLVNREAPIIADKEVDPEFGTGAVKITPAHDQTDWDVGKRHDLDTVQTISFQGKMLSLVKKYQGMNVKSARKAIVSDLKDQGFLEKVKPYQHRLGRCYRCNRAIEPLPMAQFFIKVKPLVNPVLKALKEKQVVVHGAGHSKILKHWLKNLKDWNISRQIVWGIRIPVWYQIPDPKKSPKHPNLKIRVGLINKKGNFIQDEIGKLLKKYSLTQIKLMLQFIQAPKEAKFKVSRQSPGDDWIQETDTFDTWFSSSQWPVLTLKTNQAGDFDYYYPTQVMETAYDILIFWVMRMLMMGIYLTNQVPFRQVYLHGLVRDEKGEKMSKSKGNVINPLDLVKKYGADALRMALVMSTTPGRDASVGEDKVRGMRNLTNKIWNATRFITLNLKKDFKPLTSQQVKNKTNISKNDKKFLTKLEDISKEIADLLEQLKIGLAAEKAYNYFWHWFCDECIERAKEDKLSNQAMFHGLIVFLKILHPFVPYVTEAAWQQISQWRKYPKQMLIESKWPS